VKKKIFYLYKMSTDICGVTLNTQVSFIKTMALSINPRIKCKVSSKGLLTLSGITEENIKLF
jgi:hypothetical protein